MEANEPETVNFVEETKRYYVWEVAPSIGDPAYDSYCMRRPDDLCDYIGEHLPEYIANRLHEDPDAEIVIKVRRSVYTGEELAAIFDDDALNGFGQAPEEPDDE